MAGTIDTEIAIIGAGVVGLAIAHRLLREGREVVVIDPNDPGSGASYGNAGTIADYAVLPVGTPAVLRNLPSLLFDKTSPLAIRRAGILSLAPWLLRFLRQSLPEAARRNTAAIAALVSDAADRWRQLAGEIGGDDILQARGCLYMYESARAYRDAGSDMAARRGYGVSADLLSPAELAAMEPGLPQVAGGAAFFPKALFMTDPGMMVAILAASARALGLVHIPAGITSLIRRDPDVVLRGDDFRISARHVVIAAGAFSRPLARLAGDRIPLDTERGYHVEFDTPTTPRQKPRLTRPTCPTTRGFYLCPMSGRLRVAGTVELGGLQPEMSLHRLQMLEQGARAIFPDLPPANRSWMGFRPSLPDSLPVIGPSAGGGSVIHAFGHGHIGLTLAPITAELVSDLIAGRTPQRDLAPYSAGRF